MLFITMRVKIIVSYWGVPARFQIPMILCGNWKVTYAWWVCYFRRLNFLLGGRERERELERDIWWELICKAFYARWHGYAFEVWLWCGGWIDFMGCFWMMRFLLLLGSFFRGSDPPNHITFSPSWKQDSLLFEYRIRKIIKSL